MQIFIVISSGKTKHQRVIPNLKCESATSIDYDHHLVELKKECTKKTKDVQHIHTLLDEMFDANQAFIKGLPNSQITPILEKIPAYKYGNFVRFLPSHLLEECIEKSIHLRYHILYFCPSALRPKVCCDWLRLSVCLSVEL